MGITRGRRNPYDFNYVQEEINYIENCNPQVPVNCDSNMAIETTPTNKGKKTKKFYFDRTLRTKKRGVRQARRVENTNYLLMSSEKDELELPDLDYVDLMEHGLTPFATLFVEQEKMQIWNDFINRSEDEQHDMLADHQANDLNDAESEKTNVDRKDSTSSWEDVDDHREVHPAYSAEECFQRIDHNLKSLLRKRHLPLGTLIDLEDEIISFFVEWPNSVYVSHLKSSFDRMLLHALCQYLQLESWSFNDSSGVRQTQVENNQQYFILPSMTLCDFVEYRDNRH